MAKIWGKNSKFSLSGTDISAYITEISGLPVTRDLADTTTLGDGGWTHRPGLEKTSFTIIGFYDDTATTGPEAVLSAAVVATSAVAWIFGPEGSTATMPKFSGTCWIDSVEYPVRIGDQVGFRATGRVEGTTTIGTY